MNDRVSLFFAVNSFPKTIRIVKSPAYHKEIQIINFNIDIIELTIIITKTVLEIVK